MKATLQSSLIVISLLALVSCGQSIESESKVISSSEIQNFEFNVGSRSGHHYVDGIFSGSGVKKEKCQLRSGGNKEEGYFVMVEYENLINQRFKLSKADEDGTDNILIGRSQEALDFLVRVTTTRSGKVKSFDILDANYNELYDCGMGL